MCTAGVHLQNSTATPAIMAVALGAADASLQLSLGPPALSGSLLGAGSPHWQRGAAAPASRHLLRAGDAHWQRGAAAPAARHQPGAEDAGWHLGAADSAQAKALPGAEHAAAGRPPRLRAEQVQGQLCRHSWGRRPHARSRRRPLGEGQATLRRDRGGRSGGHLCRGGAASRPDQPLAGLQAPECIGLDCCSLAKGNYAAATRSRLQSTVLTAGLQSNVVSCVA